MRVIGIDLAWRDQAEDRLANETGLVAVDPWGHVMEAGWACGTAETLRWIQRLAKAGPALASPRTIPSASRL